MIPTLKKGQSPYQFFLSSPTARQWRRIGAKRRAGVCTPLFSVYSKKSIGVGEFPDLKILADWCRKTGLSIIQLLPMNDVGTNFRPYDSESAFALEPMHLSLEDLAADIRPFRKMILELKKKFPPKDYYDTRVKPAKLALLRQIFEADFPSKNVDFQKYAEKNATWLVSYASYRVMKERNGRRAWWEWPPSEKPDEAEIGFQCWLQWQACRQLADAHAYCRRAGVLLMGDLPFLVSRDSADVWANQKYFKLDFAAGAPPDLCFAKGQRWGMPPYDWPAIEADHYSYLVQKLKYAENFYDLFRIDHFVGIFRIWTFPQGENAQGFFDPPDEKAWEEHGRKIITAILDNTSMLPCAEDLGTVPECSYKMLKEFSIPGMDVPRWQWVDEEKKIYRDPADFRLHSVAVTSTHDVAPLAAWWEFDAAPKEKGNFWKWLGLKGAPAPKATNTFIEAAIRKTCETASIFSIMLLQEWLSLGSVLSKKDPKTFRINFPGIVNEKNWRIVMPLSLEEMMRLPLNKKIREILRSTDRL